MAISRFAARRFGVLFGSVACMNGPAFAEESDLSGRILVELNAAQSVSDKPVSCTLNFVVTNGLTTALDGLVLETVLFDASGAVDQLTLFDFGALPAARPRVRQFAVAGKSCDAIGQILLNGVQSCTGEGVATSVCAGALVPSSRTTIEVIG